MRVRRSIFILAIAVIVICLLVADADARRLRARRKARRAARAQAKAAKKANTVKKAASGTITAAVRTNFNNFQRKFRKTYSPSEMQAKLKVFARQVNDIKAHNSNPKAPFKMEINEFADMSFSEFKRRLLMKETSDKEAMKSGSGKNSLQQRGLIARIRKRRAKKQAKKIAKYPASLDLRQHYKDRLPVQHQGSCGSCWAFGSTYTAEAALARKGIYTGLSEQQVLDCTGPINTCNGGFVRRAAKYIKRNGLVTRTVYPYTGKRGKCNKSLLKANKKFKIKKHKRFGMRHQKKELKFIEALNSNGVVYISFYVTQSFHRYKSGIYVGDGSEYGSTEKCKKRRANHIMAIAGYGVANNMKYWIVRNSWGAGWGEGGYIRIRRGTNECSIERGGGALFA